MPRSAAGARVPRGRAARLVLARRRGARARSRPAARQQSRRSSARRARACSSASPGGLASTPPAAAARRSRVVARRRALASGQLDELAATSRAAQSAPSRARSPRAAAGARAPHAERPDAKATSVDGHDRPALVDARPLGAACTPPCARRTLRAAPRADGARAHRPGGEPFARCCRRGHRARRSGPASALARLGGRDRGRAVARRLIARACELTPAARRRSRSRLARSTLANRGLVATSLAVTISPRASSAAELAGIAGRAGAPTRRAAPSTRCCPPRARPRAARAAFVDALASALASAPHGRRTSASRAHARSGWPPSASSCPCSRTTFDPAALTRRLRALESRDGGARLLGRPGRAPPRRAPSTRARSASSRRSEAARPTSTTSRGWSSSPRRTTSSPPSSRRRFASVETRLAALEEERLFSGQLRRRRRARHRQRRRGRHRRPGLGRDGAAHEMRWAERRGFKVELLEASAGEEAGIKSATFRASGENAYGLYTAEKGVHRLVRLSPFDSANRRQTSFAGVEVAPVVEEAGERRDRRRRPAGRHLPRVGRGRPARQQDRLGRAHHAQAVGHRRAVPERALAVGQHARPRWRCCARKLIELEERKRQEEIAKESGEAQDVNFGSQIRSYVLHPYTMVKDHRTDFEVGRRRARARRRPRRLRARLARGQRAGGPLGGDLRRGPAERWGRPAPLAEQPTAPYLEARRRLRLPRLRRASTSPATRAARAPTRGCAPRSATPRWAPTSRRTSRASTSAPSRRPTSAPSCSPPRRTAPRARGSSPTAPRRATTRSCLALAPLGAARRRAAQLARVA